MITNLKQSPNALLLSYYISVACSFSTLLEIHFTFSHFSSNFHHLVLHPNSYDFASNFTMKTEAVGGQHSQTPTTTSTQLPVLHMSPVTTAAS